jgi:NADH-quinone oxidoreductase subunit J
MDFLVANFGAILFYVIAAITVAAAVGVVTLRNPVHAAVSLLLTFLMVAVLFVMSHAEFYLFVIMLVRITDLGPGTVFLSGLAPLAVLGGVVLGCLIAIGILLGSMAAGDGGAAAMTAVEGEALGNTEAVGWILYMKYLVPFEVVSVVLLVAMIGAIVFGRRDAALAGAGDEVES